MIYKYYKFIYESSSSNMIKIYLIKFKYKKDILKCNFNHKDLRRKKKLISDNE